MPMEHEATRSPRELPLGYLLLVQAVFAVLLTWMGVRQFGPALGFAAGAFMLGTLVAVFFFDRRRKRTRLE